MSDEIKIEDGIPIPEKKHKKILYPFLNMQVGQSFTCPKKVRASTVFWKLRSGFEFTVRSIDKNTVRVWRTK